MAAPIPDASPGALLGLPKVELHCHLVGALRTQTVIAIHRERGMDLPTWDPDELARRLGPPAHPSLREFLKPFPVLRNCLCTPEALERVMFELCEDQAADGVVYLEVRFAPGDIHDNHGIPYREIFAALEAGSQAARRRYGIEVTLTPGLSRERGAALAEEVVAACIANLRYGVTGLDLFGDEAAHPADPFADAFRQAGDAGLGITVHAGEAGGPENVATAVRLLGARRIGHGSAAASSPAVLELLRNQGVFIETCPTSNVQTGAAASLRTHPLPLFLESGIGCGVFTDDPSVCGTTLSREYQLALSEIGLSDGQLQGCVAAAAAAAFAPTEVRRRVQSLVERGWDEHGDRVRQTAIIEP